jgi:hypothetical protein
VIPLYSAHLKTAVSIFLKCFILPLKNLDFSLQIFMEISNIKLHKKSSSGSQVDKCGQMEGQIVMQLVSIFCDFANAPKIWFRYIALNIEG